MELKNNIVNQLGCAADKVADFADVVVDKTRLKTKLLCLKDIIKRDRCTLNGVFAQIGKLYYDNLKSEDEIKEEALELVAQADRLNLRIQKAQDLYDDLLEVYKGVKLKKCCKKDEQTTVEAEGEEVNDDVDVSVFEKENFNRDYIKATVSDKAKRLAQNAKSTAQKAKESAGEFAQNAKVKLDDVSQKAKVKATDLADKALDKVEVLADKTKEKAQNYKQNLKEPAVLAEEGSIPDETRTYDDKESENVTNASGTESEKKSNEETTDEFTF